MWKLCLFMFAALVGFGMPGSIPNLEPADIDGVDDSVLIEGKRALQKDVLSSVSCRYLKLKGYLTRNNNLKKLCLMTFYHCNDQLSKKSCSLLKAKNECSKKLSQKYCKLTCNIHGCGNAPVCKKSTPLGMQSKAIPDSRITASSWYNNRYLPSKARLHMHSYGWTVKRRRVGEWLQVDLGSKAVVNGIATQGSKLASAEWTTSYFLKYSNDGKVFHDYKSGHVFSGNTDKNSVVKHAISPPIYARYIRIYPKTWNRWPALRLELYGCK